MQYMLQRPSARSGRWPRSLRAPSSCSAGSAGARTGSQRWAPASARILRLLRKLWISAGAYGERCVASGRQPGAIVLRRDIYVGEWSTEGKGHATNALRHGYRGIPAEALIAGSVDEVAEQFRSFADFGYTEILVRHLTNDQPKVLGSLERLAQVRAAVAQA